MQEKHNSIANSLELRLSCTTPSICYICKLPCCMQCHVLIDLIMVPGTRLLMCVLVGVNNDVITNTRVMLGHNFVELRCSMIQYDTASVQAGMQVFSTVFNLKNLAYFVSLINTLWPSSDTIWQHICGSTLVQVMACCLMAPSHYLN